MDDRRPALSFNLGSPNKQLLRIGIRTDIKRSDGRVHSAYVAGINYGNRSVTVEWFEDGETKGKEIDMATLQALNPDLIISLEPRISNEYNNKFQSNSKASISSSHCVIQNPPTNKSPSKEQNQDDHESTHNDARPDSCESSKYPLEVGYNRTSSTVREVERLKKNREQRRQRYANEKAEKKALGTLATNPHRTLINMITDYRNSLTIKPLTENDVIENHLITVCVRKRPLNKREMAHNEVDVITIPSKNQLILHEPKHKVDLTKYMENQMFRFDYAFDENSTNEFVYKYTTQPLVKMIFQGGFATCFAYGQTGSGKTHTMGGNFVGKNQDCIKGVYAMATADIFKLAHSNKYKSLKLAVSSSFFEIYSGKLFDLLANKAKLKVLEDAKQQVQVVGLTEKTVTSPEEVLKLIQQGSAARTSGQTAVNIHSSRSHAVFQIILRKADNKNVVFGKLSLIDLAGNERGADTSSINRQTRMEGAEINKSLLALKECIRALGRKKAHLPFRVSKLTQVLRDSFVGANSRTCMIAMISPGVSAYEQSLNTLRYADRVKELVAENPEINQTDAESDNYDENELSQLTSLAENEISPELLNFHQIVSELQTAEDNMIDNQKSTVEHMVDITEKAQTLLKMADVVDFNPDEYCEAWEKLLTTAITELTKAKAVVFDFKSKMIKEEKYSFTKFN